MLEDRAVVIADSCRPVRASAVAYVELDGEAVLYNEDDTSIHLLNPTATLVWSCLDGRSTLAEIVDDLAGAFGVEPEVIRPDVVLLLDDLASRGLVQGIPGASPAEAADAAHLH